MTKVNKYASVKQLEIYSPNIYLVKYIAVVRKYIQSILGVARATLVEHVIFSREMNILFISD